MTEQLGLPLAGEAGRDSGMKRSANAQDNIEAVGAAAVVLERFLRTRREPFTAADIIREVEAQGITARNWQCIGGMLRSASMHGRMVRLATVPSSRPTRHCGNQALWRSLEVTNNV